MPQPDRILEMVWAYAPPIVLGAAVNARLFDHLDAGPRTLQELAQASGNSERGIRPVLNVLVGLQLVTRDTGGRYALTPDSAAFLVSGKPGYLGGFVEFSAANLIYPWLGLRDVMRTGKPADTVNRTDNGDQFFQGLVEPIFAMSYHVTQAVGEKLGLKDLKTPARVLDIGAGSAVWSISFAQQSPQIKATAQDLPGVLDVTKRMVDRFGLGDRFAYLAGDFKTIDLGSGYDFVTLGHILHSEGAEGSRNLLKKAYAALNPGGRIVISEFVVNEDRSGPMMPLIFAVNMLVFTETGDTFSFEEMSRWLGEAGFKDPQRIDPGGPASVIVARK